MTARTLSSSPQPSIDDYCESPSCYFHETLVQLECTQHQDSAKARPTDLESTVVWGFGPMWQKCKVLHEPPDCGRHLFFRTPDARSLEMEIRACTHLRTTLLLFQLPILTFS